MKKFATFNHPLLVLQMGRKLFREFGSKMGAPRGDLSVPKKKTNECDYREAKI